MLTPGFIIKNETIWPIQISLNQVSPLYFEVINPGETFVRNTGSVWFSIRASVFLDERTRITTANAILPVALIVGSVIISAVTAGAAAFAKGPALAAAAAAGVQGVNGLGSAAMLATATASAQLVNAGFSASASLVIGGAIVGSSTTALTATMSAALKEIFRVENIATAAHGMYAGPPWPFRRRVRSFSVVGGPIPVRVPGKDQVEFIGQPLRIVPTQPRVPYSGFELQTGTALQPTDASFRFMLAENRDLVVFKTDNTDTEKTEVHVLAADAAYQAFSRQNNTMLDPTDNTWQFAIAPNRDVYAIKQRNTDSGTTEVIILTVQSGYRIHHAHTRTALGPTDRSWAFAVNSRGDLVAIKKNNTDSRSTEVHVLAANTSFRQYSLQTGTPLPPTDDTWEFALGPDDDLYAFQKSGTASGTTEVNVLTAASNYQQFALRSPTALHDTDETWALRAAANRDIFCIKQSDTMTDTTEVHVLKY